WSQATHRSRRPRGPRYNLARGVAVWSGKGSSLEVVEKGLGYGGSHRDRRQAVPRGAGAGHLDRETARRDGLLHRVPVGVARDARRRGDRGPEGPHGRQGLRRGRRSGAWAESQGREVQAPEELPSPSWPSPVGDDGPHHQDRDLRIEWLTRKASAARGTA